MELLRGGAKVPRKLPSKQPYSRVYSKCALVFLQRVERVGSYQAYVDMVAFHRDPARVVATLAEAIRNVPIPVLRHISEYSGPVVEG